MHLLKKTAIILGKNIEGVCAGGKKTRGRNELHWYSIGGSICNYCIRKLKKMLIHKLRFNINYINYAPYYFEKNEKTFDH